MDKFVIELPRGVAKKILIAVCENDEKAALEILKEHFGTKVSQFFERGCGSSCNNNCDKC